MPNTREKLIKLLNIPFEVAKNGITLKINMPFVEQVADHLITNGVTVNEWISVKDRLPEKNMKCLCRYVFGDNYDYPFEQVLYYYSIDKKPHFQNEGSLGLKVTHWMPLPQPPKEEK